MPAWMRQQRGPSSRAASLTPTMKMTAPGGWGCGRGQRSPRTERLIGQPTWKTRHLMLRGPATMAAAWTAPRQCCLGMRSWRRRAEKRLSVEAAARPWVWPAATAAAVGVAAVAVPSGRRLVWAPAIFEPQAWWRLAACGLKRRRCCCYSWRGAATTYHRMMLLMKWRGRQMTRWGYVVRGRLARRRVSMHRRGRWSPRWRRCLRQRVGMCQRSVSFCSRSERASPGWRS